MSKPVLTETSDKTKQKIARSDHHPASARRSFQGGLNPILQLQRTLGNRRVVRLIKAKRLTPDGKIIGLQPKLTVGAADDQYEHEAEHVARQVMSMPSSVAANSMQRDISPENDKDKMLHPKPLAASITPFMQRQTADNEESEDKQGPIQAKFLTETSKGLLQRQPEADEEEKKPIQKSGGSMSDSFETGDDVESQVSQSKGRGSPLPDSVRAYMEPRFCTDFSHVHVHTGSEAINMNRKAGAQAFTHGSDIYFGEGRSPTNSELTAHELTHVVQQTGGAPFRSDSLFQRTKPNKADARLQRTMDDDHDLRSPRFSGDQRLEACFDNKTRLTQGARGASVQKVQQALIDLGYDLGPAGADGNYGQKTWNAVKRFKAREQLGFETMGDVGPGTMTRLDELFPPPPSDVDFGEENDGLSCPADVDIVAALEARPASINALVTTERTAAASASVGVATPHIGIPEAVKRFKAKVNVSSVADSLNVSQKGQFFWGRQVSISVEAEINRIAADASAAAFVTKARAAFARIMNFKDGTALVNELRVIGATSRSLEKPAMQALVRSQSLSGGGLENVLWAALNKDPTDSLPNLAPFRSLTTLQSLRSFDKTGCGSHALRIAQRLKKKGGITTANPKVRAIGIGLVGGTLIRDRRSMGSPTNTTEPAATAAVDATSSFHLGDFFSQKGALSVVAQMQSALDAGQLIHARVMSGVGAGTDPDVPADPIAKRIPLGIAPPEEHSLLIIGFDGSQFVFHDPDASVSRSPENGFGTLFFDPSEGRLSTAPNPEEMPVDSHGAHRRGDKRYQVISLTTI